MPHILPSHSLVRVQIKVFNPVPGTDQPNSQPTQQWSEKAKSIVKTNLQREAKLAVRFSGTK